jgi:hypothetical protein
MRFAVLNDPNNPRCLPLEELKDLLRTGRMPRTAAVWSRLPGGDCSLLARMMMLDLQQASSHLGWCWVAADCVRVGKHHWLECDDWAR